MPIRECDAFMFRFGHKFWGGCAAQCVLRQTLTHQYHHEYHHRCAETIFPRFKKVDSNKKIKLDESLHSRDHTECRSAVFVICAHTTTSLRIDTKHV